MYIRETIGIIDDLPEPLRRKIYQDNAVRLLGLPS
jgi:hypothetical protein